MKTFLTIGILASTTLFVQAAEQTITEKARDKAGALVDKTKELAADTKEVVLEAAHSASKATRSAWNKTVAYVSDDMPSYREGANMTLSSLSREIAEIKARTPASAPAYFQTRILALEEQRDFLGKRLAHLSSEQLRDRSSGPRHEFDQCMADLEGTIDSAKLVQAGLSN